MPAILAFKATALCAVLRHISIIIVVVVLILHTLEGEKNLPIFNSLNKIHLFIGA